MKQSVTTTLLAVLMSMVGAKAYAYVPYDIAVKNADGVTIYYKYINDGKELEVTFREMYTMYEIYYNYEIRKISFPFVFSSLIRTFHPW